MKKALNQKSKIKLLRSDEVWQPQVVGDRGHRYALKTGAHTAEWRALRAKIAAWRRRVRETRAQVFKPS